MIIYRISNFVELDGAGGLLSDGRWHREGVEIIYTSEHQALCLLEWIANKNKTSTTIPHQYQRIDIQFRNDILVKEINEADLGIGWQANKELTQSKGMEWLESNSTLFLKVPSSLIHDAYNYLINPKHQDIERLASSYKTMAVDDRLIYKKDNDNFEKALDLAIVKFGDEYAAITWLGLSHLRLIGKKPQDVLNGNDKKLINIVFDMLKP